MLYYSNKARMSHIKRIKELIKTLCATPIDNISDTLNTYDIIEYLNQYKIAIEKEMEERI